MDRARPLLVALALALALMAGSRPRIVGDGGEYIALALNFASLHGPAIAPAQVPDIERRIGALDAVRAARLIPESAIRGRGSRYDFVHFWFYSLLATPAVWVTDVLGMPPTAAFAGLNVLLLGLALWVSLPRLGGPLCLLLFGGPIVWWVDKAHTEPFTFALLVVAFVLVRERPWWSMVAAGAAATQNPPIAVLVGLFGFLEWTGHRALLRDRRFLAGAVAGAALALLGPTYTLWRHGTPSLLFGVARRGTPALAEITATIADPDIGLVANFPVFALVLLLSVALIAWRKPRELLARDVLAAGTGAAVFLWAFAQAVNVHNAATPSISRYALWLIPLAIPVLGRAARLGRVAWQRFLWGAGAVSAVTCAFAFHPGLAENSREPTLVASYLWTRHPAWTNPLPEIFVEAMLGGEGRWAPVATGGCEKILLGGRDAAWPIPCFPGSLPETCRRRGVLCYANRDGGRYSFVQASGRGQDDYVQRPDVVWPPAAEPHVRAVFVERGWWNLDPRPDGVDVLRAATDIGRVVALAGDGRFVFVLVRPGPGATLRFRLPGAMTGVVIDALTGTVTGGATYDGPPHGVWDLRLPQGSDLLLLELRPARPE